MLPWDDTYDPWAWIVWGREIIHLDLHTADGPSWKPLPVLFTTPFALAGSAAPALWLVVARAGGLLAVAAAYGAGRRLAGPVAAVAASVALLLNLDFIRVVWLGSSEGILVAALLAGLERHIAGRPRTAFALGCACALIRPEAWPFLALYAAWLMWRDRSAWPLVSFAAAAIAFLWLAPEFWGSGQLWRSADRALQPVAAAATYAPDPALAVVHSTQAMLLGPVPAAALVAIAFAVVRAFRRPSAVDTAVLATAALALAWIALVAVMTTHGFSGNSRYVMGPASLICVLAGVGVARAGHVLGALIARARAVPAATTAALLAAGLVPFTLHNASELGGRMAALGYQAKMRTSLQRSVERLGRDRVLACGRPATEDYSVPMLAWYLRVHIAHVALDAPRRGVVFRAAPGPEGELDPVLPASWRYAFAFRAGPVFVFTRCG